MTNKCKRNKKRIYALMLAIMLAFTTICQINIYKENVTANESVTDGIYSIPLCLWSASKDQESMGNGAFEQTGKLVVNNGQTYLYIHMNPLDFMGMTGYLAQLDLLQNIQFNSNNYPTEYTTESGEIISEYDVVDEYNGSTSTDINCVGKMYPKIVKIPVAYGQELTWIHIYVPVMGSLGFGDQLARIHLDYTNMNTMTEDEINSWNSLETTATQSPEVENTETPASTATAENTLSPLNTDAPVIATTAPIETTTAPIETTPSSSLDRTQLKELIDKAQELLVTDSVYTDATLSELQTAFNTAQTVYSSSSATQILIDAQCVTLQEAINSLVEISDETLDKDNLADGKYSVYVSLWKDNSDEASMGNPAFNHTALITVSGGSYIMEIGTKVMVVGSVSACLRTLQIQQNDESYVYADITATGNSIDDDKNLPSAFSFTMPSTNEYTAVKIDPHVEAMGYQVLDARLKVSWDTLKMVSADTELEDDSSTSTNIGTPAVNIHNKKLGIKIKAAKNILPKGVKLKSSKITKGSKYKKITKVMKSVSTTFTAYNINVVSSKDKKVTPSGMVTVSIKYPTGYTKGNSVVYRVDGTSKVKLNGSSGNGYYVFSTTQFGSFVFARTDNSESGNSSTDSSNTDTSGIENATDNVGSSYVSDSSGDEDDEYIEDDSTEETDAPMNNSTEEVESAIAADDVQTSAQYTTSRKLALIMLGISMLISATMAGGMIKLFYRKFKEIY